MRPKAPHLRQGNAREAKPEIVHVPIDAGREVEIPTDRLGPVGVEVFTTLWEWGKGVYTHTDAHTIERYASLVERRAEYLATLRYEGWVTVGSQGQSVVHPLARLLQDVEQKMVALEDRLGLSPESRVRLGLATIEQESKLDEFLKRTKGDN